MWPFASTFDCTRKTARLFCYFQNVRHNVSNILGCSTPPLSPAAECFGLVWWSSYCCPFALTAAAMGGAAHGGKHCLNDWKALQWPT